VLPSCIDRRHLEQFHLAKKKLNSILVVAVVVNAITAATAATAATITSPMCAIFVRIDLANQYLINDYTFFSISQFDAEEEELLRHYKKMWAHHLRVTTACCCACSRRSRPSSTSLQARPKDIIVSIRKEVPAV